VKVFQYIFIFVCCISCQFSENASIIELKSSNSNLELKNGVLYFNTMPFYGKLVDKNANDIRLLEVEYANGRKHGLEKKKYQDGAVAEERFYIQGKKSGVHRAWYKNGQQKFEYHFNTLGLYHGTVREWYQKGQTYTSFNFRNGKEEGAQQMWNSDGKIRANFVVKNGERYGLIGLKKCKSLSTSR